MLVLNTLVSPLKKYNGTSASKIQQRTSGRVCTQNVVRSLEGGRTFAPMYKHTSGIASTGVTHAQNALSANTISNDMQKSILERNLTNAPAAPNSLDKTLLLATANVECVWADSLTRSDGKQSAADPKRIVRIWKRGPKRQIRHDGNSLQQHRLSPQAHLPLISNRHSHPL